jgi:hypothetical protein
MHNPDRDPNLANPNTNNPKLNCLTLALTLTLLAYTYIYIESELESIVDSVLTINNVLLIL